MIPNYRNQGSMTSACQAMPIFFKGLLFTTLALSVFDIILGGPFSSAFTNFSALTVFHFQFWRLFTSFLVDSIISLLFSLLSCYFLLVPFEKKYSTPFTIADFLFQSFVIQSALSLVSLIGYEIEWGMANSKGLWAVWIVYLWRFAFDDPEAQMRVICLPCTIPRKYYPLFILALFMLMGALGFDSILAAVLGYLQCRFCSGYFLKYNLSTLKYFEVMLCGCVKSHSGYYSIQKCKTQLATVCKLEFGSAESVGAPAPPQQSMMAQPARGVASLFGSGTVVDPSNKQPVTVDDVRDHWARKDEDNSTDSNSGLGAPSTISEDRNLI